MRCAACVRLQSSDRVTHYYMKNHSCSSSFSSPPQKKIPPCLQVAARIRAAGVHVLVDLTGYTITPRAEVFALRSAPVQLQVCSHIHNLWRDSHSDLLRYQFHGFPGTMGANFIDYITTDLTTSTPEMTEHFDEYYLALPYSYMMSDHRWARVWC